MSSRKPPLRLIALPAHRRPSRARPRHCQSCLTSFVYLSNDENNDESRQWGLAIKEAGEQIGWKVTVNDGQGSAVKWLQAVNQAIAIGADGFFTSLASIPNGHN